MGILNIQNFWYLLKDTWLQQIETKYHNKNKSSYLKHISTANNNNFNNISISDEQAETVFFGTLSLVFNINIQIMTISNNSHITTIINTCKDITRPTKIINKRKSINGGNIYEPWINPTILQQPAEVQYYIPFLTH